MMFYEGNTPENLGSAIFLAANEEVELYYYQGTKGWDTAYWKSYNMIEVTDSGKKTIETPESSENPQETIFPLETEKPGVNSTPKPSGIPSQTEKPLTVTTQKPDSNQVDNNGENEDFSDATEHSNSISSDETNGTFVVNKTKIIKIKQKKKRVVITVKKKKDVSGYEIFYRKGKTGKYKKVILKSWKKNKYNLRKLKKGKRYYVKVRCYNVVNGTKYYSDFSKIVKFKKKSM